MSTFTASVRGRVQGVAFRYYTQREARRLRLTGWVRNEADGSVLVVAAGNREHLAKFLEFLHKGPDAAEVQNVVVTWSDKNKYYDEFEIR